MTKKMYIEKISPNKQQTLEAIYKFIGKYVKNTSAVILCGARPFRALRRLYRNKIIGANKVFCYELSKEVCEFMMQPDNSVGWKQALNRLRGANFYLDGGVTLYNESVANAPIKRLMDLDFCGNWLAKRNSAAYSNPDSAIVMFKNSLSKQRKMYPKEWCATLGTVTSRGNLERKSTTLKCLNIMLAELGYEVETFNGMSPEIGVLEQGVRISTTGCKKGNKTFHAYECNVKVKPINSKASKHVKVKFHRYKDDTPMVNFAIVHKTL